METVGIVGSGNSARALAAHLASGGRKVALLTRDESRVAALRGGVVSTGQIAGRFPIDLVTEDPSRLAADCRTIFVATAATAYSDVARRLGRFVGKDHQLILFSSKFGGCIEMERSFAERNGAIPAVVEVAALFDCRVQPDESVFVRGFKKWAVYSSSNKTKTAQNAEVLRRFFPFVEAAQNVIQRGMTDFGALVHPVTMLANMSLVERRIPFLFYMEGLNPRTIVLLERVEAEFARVAEAYGTKTFPASEILRRYYACQNGSLLNSIRTVPNYKYSTSPDTLDHRFLREDVGWTLVPVQALARKAGVDTPTIDSVVHLASLLLGEDLKETGRTLETLGWKELSPQQIREQVER